MLVRVFVLMLAATAGLTFSASACDQCGRACHFPSPQGLSQCLLDRLKQHHCGCYKTSCKACEVHVHYVRGCQSNCKEKAAATISSAANGAANNQLLTYQPIVQAQAAVGFPMMPMIMPFPMMGMMQQQQQTQQRQQSGNGCDECMPRVESLEKGVQVLAERMDKIESILENQTAALVAIADRLPAPKVDQ